MKVIAGSQATDEELEGTTILDVLLGSRAHGTDRPDSDYDYRSVIIVPTAVILRFSRRERIRFKQRRKDERDENKWELERFMSLSLAGNPSTLEALLAPAEIATPEGEELRSLYPKFLQRMKVYGAHLGFANTQKRTMFSRESLRQNNAAGHFLRVLYNGIELMRTGLMTVRIAETPIYPTIMAAKRGELEKAEVARIGQQLEDELTASVSGSVLPEYADMAPLDDFCERMRRKFW